MTNIGAMLGAVTGSWLITGCLPGAFVAYGKSNKQEWGVTVGLVICAIFTLGAIYGGTSVAGFIGMALGWSWVAFMMLKAYKPTI